MENNLKSLIFLIKEKRDLKGIDDSIIEDSLSRYLTKNKIKSIPSSTKERKIIIKDIRSELRMLSGRFQSSSMDRPILLLKKKYSDILKTHSSTFERLNYYPKIKKIIYSFNPRDILDLGCGLNPIALARPGIKYYAYDIKKDDLDIVSQFFKQEGIDGETRISDLRSSNNSFPEVDICLLLKVLDLLDSKGHKKAEEVITSISAKYFVISFSTKTLSGKPMNHPQRGWIERLLTRKNYSFYQFQSKNEIFYIAEKGS